MVATFLQQPPVGRLYLLELSQLMDLQGMMFI
jgi:hypothetical protein